MSEQRPTNAGKMQDGRFKKGQSGNPTGKKKGTRNKATQAALVLLEGETEALTRKAIEMAKEGDMTALKLCLDKILPSLKSTAPPVSLNIPLANSLTDTAKSFINAAAIGEIPPDIAANLVSAVASVAKVEEIEQVKDRLEALERAILNKEKKR